MKSILHSVVVTIICLAAPLAQAQVAGAPATIDYQGQVLDTAGAVLAPATPTNYTMQFRVYDQQTGGTIIWAESQIVTVDKGAFSVRLGSGVAIPAGAGTEGTKRDLRLAFDGTERYLGLTVTIPGNPTVEITPRLAFLSAPFALVAERAKSADTAALATVASSVVQASGNSTLGVTTATSLLLTGQAQINGANVLEFGAGVAGKETNAGKIWYNTSDAGTLDIIGAGTTNTNRKIRLYAEGGAQINGPLTVTGKITGDGSGLTGVNADVGAGSITLAKLASESVDLSKLVAAVKEALCPPGTIVAFGGSTAPPGWFLCNGAEISKSSYNNLFVAIGTNFGNGGGDSTKFTLPDFRGRFLRGRDGNQGRDPDRAARIASTEGGATGDSVGSLQSFALQRHAHDYQDIWVSAHVIDGTTQNIYPKLYDPPASFVDVPGGYGTNTNAPLTIATTIKGWQIKRQTEAQAPAPTTSTETRPVNVYVNYIIKY
jgi:microcystin-dependent protein